MQMDDMKQHGPYHPNNRLFPTLIKQHHKHTSSVIRTETLVSFFLNGVAVHTQVTGIYIYPKSYFPIDQYA